jgi:hypothetical protein
LETATRAPARGELTPVRKEGSATPRGTEVDSNMVEILCVRKESDNELEGGGGSREKGEDEGAGKGEARKGKTTKREAKPTTYSSRLFPRVSGMKKTTKLSRGRQFGRRREIMKETNIVNAAVMEP